MTIAAEQLERTVVLRPAGLGRNFGRLWGAAAVSNLGDGIRDAALPLLAASLTGDPLLVAGVAAAGRLPWLVFGLLSGAIVDRVDRRLLMMRADAFRTVLMGALAVSVATGVATIPILFLVAFAHGVAETLFDNASHAILPSLVRRDDLERANGRLEAALTVCNEFAGPPLGALLFVSLAAVPFVADAGSFLLATLLVAGIRGRYRPERAAERKPTLRADILEGLRFVWSNRLLRTLSLTAAVVNMVLYATWAIFVLYSVRQVGTSELGYGVLLSTFALGGLVGGLYAARFSARLGPGRAITLAILVAAGAELTMGLVPQVAAVAAMLAVVAFSGTLWNVVTTSLRQSLTPDHLLGRVNSAHRVLGWGSMPVGALLGGLIAKGAGLQAPFLVAGVALLLAAALTSRLFAGIKTSRGEDGQLVIDLAAEELHGVGAGGGERREEARAQGGKRAEGA